MTKFSFCRACHNIKQGIKTPRSVPHTCNKFKTKQDFSIKNKK